MAFPSELPHNESAHFLYNEIMCQKFQTWKRPFSIKKTGVCVQMMFRILDSWRFLLFASPLDESKLIQLSSRLFSVGAAVESVFAVDAAVADADRVATLALRYCPQRNQIPSARPRYHHRLDAAAFVRAHRRLKNIDP